MSGDSLDDILDSLFHGCAWAAYIDKAVIEGCAPDLEATRQRAYRYYEEELAKQERNRKE
jgi:hypothetical protein